MQINDGFDSAQDARTYLYRTLGYAHAFSSPGRPMLWVKGKDRRAVARKPDGLWYIVPYPEPATGIPDVVGELETRDASYDRPQCRRHWRVDCETCKPEDADTSWLDEPAAGGEHCLAKGAPHPPEDAWLDDDEKTEDWLA